MAGPRICRNLTSVKKDKLAGGVFTKGSNTPTPFLAISHAQTPALAQALSLTQALAFAPGLSDMYTNIDLQKIIHLAQELFIKGQEHGQLQANSTPRDCPLNAKIPNLYYGSLHMECYYFC